MQPINLQELKEILLSFTVKEAKLSKEYQDLLNLLASPIESDSNFTIFFELPEENDFNQESLVFIEKHLVGNLQNVIKKEIRVIFNLQKKLSQSVKSMEKLSEKPPEEKPEQPKEKLQNTAHSHQKNPNSKKKAIAGVKQILAVAANKGGVGKSTIACNLAIKLANKGYKIALVDADIYGPSVPHLMKLENKKPEIINNLIKPLNAFGVKVMSIGFIVNESSAGIWRGPMVTKILFQLFHQVLWAENQAKEIDLMIIDMPPGTGDVYLSIGESLAIDGMMLVSTPQQLAVSDLKKSIDCCHKLEIPIVGIVENMSFLPVMKKISWLQKFLSIIFCGIKFNFFGGKIKNNISKKYHIKKEYIFGKNCLKNLAKDNNINVIAELPISQILQDINKINSNNNKENKIIINTLFDKIIKYLENNLIKVKK